MRTLKFAEKDKLWFTSDLHFDHRNIIELCNRPFNDIGHMNSALINNWNSVVQQEDTVIMAGDIFLYGKKDAWNNIIPQLVGHKILVEGNHDDERHIPRELFDIVSDGFINIRVKDEDVKDGEQRITICHYPMLSWYQSHRGAWQLYGHMHGNTISPKKDSNKEIKDFYDENFHYIEYIRPDQYDIGVDSNNFTPISYNQVKKIILSKK